LNRRNAATATERPVKMKVVAEEGEGNACSLAEGAFNQDDGSPEWILSDQR
jgi:hypothetical protein